MSSNDKLKFDQTESTSSAIRWSAFSRYINQFLQISISLLLAKLLMPESFGLLGVAIVFQQFTKVLSNLGIRAILIREKELDGLKISTLFWANCGINVLLGVSLFAISPLVGRFYEDERLTPIVAALSFCILANIFIVIPSAILQRKLALKSIAVREIGATVVSGVVAVVLALLGFGVWALVSSTILNVLAQAVLLNLLEPVSIGLRFDKRVFHQSLAYGLPLTGSGIFTYISKNCDVVLIGATLGPLALGFYSFANRLCKIPSDLIAQVIGRVMFPKLCQVQDAKSKMARLAVHSSELILLVAAPVVCAAVFLFGPTVEFVYGDKWLRSIPLIWALGPSAICLCLKPIPNQILLAVGKTGYLLSCNILFSASSIVAIVIGSRFGLFGVAVAYSCAQLVNLAIGYVVAFREIGLGSLVSVVRRVAGIAALALTSVFSAIVVFQIFDGEGLPLLSYLLAFLASSVCYILMSFAFFADDVKLIAGLIYLDKLFDSAKSAFAVSS